jgi:hypothetical protein
VTAHLTQHPGIRQHIREAELAGHPVRLNAMSYCETKRGLLAIGAHRQLVACERLWRVLGIVMIDHAVLDKARRASSSKSHMNSRPVDCLV